MVVWEQLPLELKLDTSVMPFLEVVNTKCGKLLEHHLPHHITLMITQMVLILIVGLQLSLCFNFLLFSVFILLSSGVYRWQDGAIVANNPTIFAIREAQLLWPDAQIDCLVSIGCCSVPTKVFLFLIFFPSNVLVWSSFCLSSLSFELL